MSVTVYPDSSLQPSTGYYTDEIGGGLGVVMVTTAGGNSPGIGDPTGRNDDGFRGPVDLGFEMEFFGETYSQFFISNNGNISFTAGISAFTPDGPQGQPQPIISIYFADVDTRNPSSGVCYYRIDSEQVIVTWDQVGYYNLNADRRASFQLVLRGPGYVVPPDEGPIGFFWKNVEWEYGTASSGHPAAVGFGDGNANGVILQSSTVSGISDVVSNKKIWWGPDLQPIVPTSSLNETVTWHDFITVGGTAPAVLITVQDAVYPGPRVTDYHHLGAGLVRPFVRTFHQDFASSQGTDTVMSNIGQIFGTRPGTFPWRPEFGSKLDGLRHKANTIATRELAGVYARAALSRWEPRVTLRSLAVEAPSTGDEANQIVLRPRVAVEGETGEHRLSVAVSNVAERPGGDEPRGYGVGGTRVERGLGRLTEAPLVAPPEQVLGGGLMRPFYRAQDFTHGTGVPEIMSNVGQVIGTEPGTMPWRTEFGCRLQTLRHRPNTPALRELARLNVERALSKWEPRAQLTKVDALVVRGAVESELTIRTLCKIDLFQASDEHLFEVTLK